MEAAQRPKLVLLKALARCSGKDGASCEASLAQSAANAATAPLGDTQDMRSFLTASVRLYVKN